METQKRTTITVVTYQFKVDDDLWNDWKETVPRSKSLDTRLRELIKADRDGRVLDADHTAEQPTSELHDVVDDVVVNESVIDQVTSSWDDTGKRLEQRRRAAEAAVDLARRDGQLGKATAVEELLPEYSVDGQNEETWWRRNVRPVLSEVGTYSPAEAAYILEPEA
jgi:hypothetical protein